MRPHYAWTACVAEDDGGYWLAKVQRALEDTAAYVDFNVDQFVAERGAGFVINPLTDLWRMDEEPDTAQSGKIPTGEEFPADNNNIAGALASEPYLVLNAKYGVGCWPVAVWCSIEVARELTDANLIVPGEAAFVAVYGKWADYNGDGYIQHRGINECAEDPATGEHIQITVRPEGATCREEEFIPIDEVSGSDPLPRVVGYVSPGQWSREAGALGEPRMPDLFFRYAGNGVYVAPGQFFPSRVTLEGSVTTSVVLEAFEGRLAVDGARLYAPVDAKPTDTDVFAAPDASGEALYDGLVGGAGRAASQVVSDALDRLPASLSPSSVDWATQPVAEATTGSYDPEVTGFDHVDNWHPYLDVRLTETVYGSAGPARFEHRAGPDTPLVGGPERSAPGQFMVSGRLGVWHDSNGDGWIGAPRASDFCPDARDCGHTADPNEYDTGSEFAPYCPTGTFDVTVTPRTPGAAWPKGAYVWREASESASDARDDGELDHLVLEGPVILAVACEPYTGALVSLDRLLLPTGGIDVGFNVSSASVTIDFMFLGSGTTESVDDVDVHEARTL